MPTVEKYKLLIVALLLAACTSETEIQTNQINSLRQKKDEVFRDEKQSPMSPKYIADFKGLDYFPIDMKYIVEATLTRTPQLTSERLVMNNGEKELFVKYGNVTFELDGKTHTLSIYENLEPSPLDLLFLPFTDKSNDKTTYAGGRYVEVSRSKTGTVTIDFNRAFNPYCVYNENYVCPIPPSENYIDAEINAGEKNFSK